MGWLNDMAQIFPLMRGGGAFLVAIGLGILLGAFGNQRVRIAALIAGIVVVVVIVLIAVMQRSGPRVTIIETKPEDEDRNA